MQGCILVRDGRHHKRSFKIFTLRPSALNSEFLFFSKLPQVPFISSRIQANLKLGVLAHRHTKLSQRKLHSRFPHAPVTHTNPKPCKVSSLALNVNAKTSSSSAASLQIRTPDVRPKTYELVHWATVPHYDLNVAAQ